MFFTLLPGGVRTVLWLFPFFTRQHDFAGNALPYFTNTTFLCPQ
ncbi:predicted protein [Streptomyces iranensis]|uniref:Uncharacterized protein n=1 Tax=Streptomyces iranensis TaxID=576784 RepID=A0A060ZRY5_9ACTN|nr:predicted protein [Streptomyces iranensis]